MDQLYQLFCIPKAPSLSFNDFKENNFGPFLDKSMQCAPSITDDNELKQEASKHMQKLLANKSNSPSNTLRTINTMFESASKTCHFDRERALIEWLQVCVSTAVELALDPSRNENYPSTENPKVTEKKVTEKKKPASPKKATRKTPPKDDDEWLDDSEEEALGDSDDDYEPFDDQDSVVPEKPKKKASSSSPRRKKEDQVVPSKEPQLSLIKEGAGTKAIHKYFIDMDTTKNNVLPSGYFAKAFFFPSKDSFNAFLSVLNSATKTIDICVFAFTDDDVADAIIAAKKRNVTIRIITDNQQAAGKGADAKRLSESYGIPFKTDHTQGYMHNKFAIVDDKTLINGSFNWSKGARFKNRENVLITNIPLCIQEFQAQFDALWEEF
ncbi:hypothetical protein G6F57_005102 [Rhizopus arrhizus]|uniref:Mitochondrial cardiolipin hydrolase n=1 Tax=Rhizopus oryzae TaxID=64495 RepID=A0A9P7BNF5_RHIOR|nr:hypothetical protein G6F23_004858 [Rhizopus arrhizus]KAG1428971.1 hypothetical protein G6F58_000277 [Rhizopus delemar]KAG0766007.1 hypothetical protein G6F24_003947 [Rhizopus arrhizus]KAG0793753.1 hypothetical protein G6F21_003376 [Rhizopus arrhizus]KAG0814920.1 hypothetical protein G6F20_004388 [Rhizopus arrhizus]